MLQAERGRSLDPSGQDPVAARAAVTPSARRCSEIPAAAGAFFGRSGYLFDVQKQQTTAEEAIWFPGSSELVQGQSGQACVYVSCFFSSRAVSRAAGQAEPRKMRAEARSPSASHVLLLRSCRRLLGASIFKCHVY